jgi:UDP-glucose 4-epimerase
MTLAWITGAAGFIGRHLARHLTDAGLRVAGLDLVGTMPEGMGERLTGWRQGAVSLETLSGLAADTGMPDMLYHLAGGSSVGASLADPYGDFSATVGSTGLLLKWLHSYSPKTRLVIVSSAAVYGNIHASVIGEDDVTSPYSPYGAHKFAMEVVCRGWAGSFGLRVVTARLFSVYGPGLTKQLLWDLSGKLCSNEPVVMLGGTGDELRDWTHVEDVVRALDVVASLASPEMPVVNVGTGKAFSVRTIAECLARAHGRDPECLRFSGESRAGDPLSLVAAPGRLQGLGFDWRETLEDGIAQYASWYKLRGQE